MNQEDFFIERTPRCECGRLSTKHSKEAWFCEDHGPYMAPCTEWHEMAEACERYDFGLYQKHNRDVIAFEAKLVRKSNEERSLVVFRINEWCFEIVKLHEFTSAIDRAERYRRVGGLFSVLYALAVRMLFG